LSFYPLHPSPRANVVFPESWSGVMSPTVPQAVQEIH
jgi:hypothetical protein